MREFFQRLSGRDRYMVGNLFFLFLIQGIFVLLIGSVLPMMKEEYGLSYQVGGLMISAHSIGNMAAGLLAGLIPMVIGLKRSVLWLNATPFIGFAIALVTGNPYLLIFGMLLTGIGCGAVTNYSNQAASVLSEGSPAPLNALQGFFAVGAVISPVLVLACTRNGNSGWRTAVLIVILLGALSTVSSAFMKMDSISWEQPKDSGHSLGFLREKLYWISVLILFLYLCVEGTLMGWMVTYFVDSGVVQESAAQLLTSLLWSVILIGRFACSVIGGRVSSTTMIRVMSIGILAFLAMLLLSRNLVPMLIATAGLGFALSGMYGTAIANAGDVFTRFPFAMSVFITISGFGSIITPTIVGSVAEVTGIRPGMFTLFVPAVLLLILSIINRGPQIQEKTETILEGEETICHLP